MMLAFTIKKCNICNIRKPSFENRRLCLLTREFMAESLCNKCSGLCCRYFALPIDNPTTAKDYDDIRWYLCHENVVIFIEKKQRPSPCTPS